MSRSGTSLAEQIIAGHPDALPCGELHAMHAIESHLDPAEGIGARRRHYLDHLPRDHARDRLVTDMLPTNFERIGMIHELFLGVDVRPDMLAPHRGERTEQTACRLQVREPLQARAIDAWRACEELLVPVSERLRKAGIGDEGRRTTPRVGS